MPFLEPTTGDVAHGVGGGMASRNNVPFGHGGVGGWADRSLIAFANGDDAWLVSTYNILTGHIARVSFGGTVTTANTSYAGGGHIACWRGGNGPERGIYATTGLR